MFIHSAKIVRASKRRETFNAGCCSTLCVPRVCISALYFSPCWRMPHDAKTWKNCRLEINHFSERARMCSDMSDEAQGWHRNFSQFRPPTIQTISIYISTLSVICTLLMDIELIIGIFFLWQDVNILWFRIRNIWTKIAFISFPYLLEELFYALLLKAIENSVS